MAITLVYGHVSHINSWSFSIIYAVAMAITDGMRILVKPISSDPINKKLDIISYAKA